jgi:DNA-binding transcriptional ArsR family regulator
MATKKRAAAKTRSNTEVFDPVFGKVMSNPIRVRALTILNERVASPNELAKELEEGLSQVSYHVKVLLENNCIELVKTEPRRGAVEHFYRATARAFLTERDWRQVPDSIRPSLSGSLLETVIDDVVGALESNSFDARDDRHLSWTPLIVDEKGWEDLTAVLADSLDRVLEVQTESAARLAEAKEEGLSVTATMLGYETRK